jgi:hypothetical protein
MDEPTHANESRFWDQVVDWLLDARELQAFALSESQIEAMLRDSRGDPHIS